MRAQPLGLAPEQLCELSGGHKLLKTPQIKLEPFNLLACTCLPAAELG